MNPDKMYNVFCKKIKALTNPDVTNSWTQMKERGS